MPIRLRLVPGWKRLVLLAAPITLGLAVAGGFSADVGSSRLPDLAGRLKDGEQIKVPFAKTSSGTVIVRTSLNQSTLEELEALPGFTQAFAEECIDYRTNFGGFQNTRELV